MSSGTTLTCATCGNAEPEGARFCGSCGAPFVPLAPEALRPAAEEPAPIATDPARAPTGTGRLRWVAAGAAVGLLVVGAAVAGVLTLTEDDEPVVVRTEPQPLPDPPPETEPPVVSATLIESLSPQYAMLAESQRELNERVRSLRAGVESFAALRQSAGALAARVTGAQEFVSSLAPADAAETATLSLLNRALAEHLAYANAISSFPPRPRSFTTAQAQEARARAEQTQAAYSLLAGSDPALSGVVLSSYDHVLLLELVPSENLTTAPGPRVEIDLVALFVGIRPDDPVGAGRCFGPYTPRASLTVSGVVHRTGFIQCGDDADGDPRRASGEYAFSSGTFRAATKIVRLTGQAAIDESSSSSQRGSRVTWTVLYRGTPICSETVVWSGARPVPRDIDCRFPMLASAGGFDVGQLRIRQVVSLASSGSFWAGLLDPKIVAEAPR